MTTSESQDKGASRFNHNDLEQVRNRYVAHNFLAEESMDQRLLEAERFTGLGEWQKAHDIYTAVFNAELVRKHVDSSHVQLIATNYGLCLIYLGRAEQAVSVLQCLSGAQLKPAEYFVNLSLAYLHTGKYGDAEQIAKDGLALYKEDNDMLGNLLISQSRQKKYLQALETAITRLRLDRSAHALEEVGALLRRIGDSYASSNWPEAVKHYKSAISLLEEAKELDPTFTTGRYNLAQTWFAWEDYDRASQELLELNKISMHPSLVEQAAILMGMCLDRMGAYQECVDFCHRWRQHFPDSVGLARTMNETIADGFCIGKMQDGGRVIEQNALGFFSSIVENPQKRLVSDFCYLARLLDWMGEYTKAMAMLDQAAAIEPDLWEIPFNRASFLLQRRELETALASALEAANSAPWRPQPYRLLAVIYDALGRAKDATGARMRAELIREKRVSLRS